MGRDAIVARRAVNVPRPWMALYIRDTHRAMRHIHRIPEWVNLLGWRRQQRHLSSLQPVLRLILLHMYVRFCHSRYGDVPCRPASILEPRVYCVEVSMLATDELWCPPSRCSSPRAPAGAFERGLVGAGAAAASERRRRAADRRRVRVVGCSWPCVLHCVHARMGFISGACVRARLRARAVP